MDLITQAEAETYLNFSSGRGDQALRDMITAVSAMMAHFTGRDDWGASSSRTEYHHGGRCYIAPRYWPLTSVTTIIDDPQHDFAAGDAMDADDYFVSTEDDGFIWFEGGRSTMAGRKSVQLVYTGGYASTAVIPEDLKLQCKVQVKHEWDMTHRSGRNPQPEDDQGAGQLLSSVMRGILRFTRWVPFV